MEARNIKRQGGYSTDLANNILDATQPIYLLSTELEPQVKFEEHKPTDEVIAYKAWFSQAGLPPFEVKFQNSFKLPAYLTVVTFEQLQACEVNYHFYFKAQAVMEVK
ncbi:MAG: hypothetical protein LKF43_11075 [Streptococcaceae bacterium]|jgi:hypothetical protein|nr:hypothetical protein [Streptococcaceae bacterium]